MSETSGRIMNNAWEQREEDEPENEERDYNLLHSLVVRMCFEVTCEDGE